MLAVFSASIDALQDCGPDAQGPRVWLTLKEVRQKLTIDLPNKQLRQHNCRILDPDDRKQQESSTVMPVELEPMRPTSNAMLNLWQCQVPATLCFTGALAPATQGRTARTAEATMGYCEGYRLEFS